MEQSVRKYFKYCLVPLCRSTTVKTPNKIFIRLPQDPNRRKKWLKACRRETKDISPYSNALHVCEDHFNLKEDMKNYVKFKLMGGTKKMKEDVVPHIFDCQPDRKRASSHADRAAPLKRVKMQLVQEAFASSSTTTTLLEDQNSESPAKRLKIEPYDISETHVEESKLIPVKIEPLDNHLSNIVRDLCEPAVLNNHSFVLKQEPLDINESSSINSPQPGTSGVTVKSEPDDTDSPNNVNFSAVYLPEETDARIKQEIELPPDDL